MSQNNNPNFDFYSFNAPEEPKPSPKTEEPTDPVPVEEVTQENTEPSPAPMAEQTASEEDSYARDIDRAIARDKLRASYPKLGWAFVAMTVAWYIVAQTLVDQVYTLAPHIYESYWFSILASTLPLYAVGIPLLYILVRKLPTEIPERKKLKLSHFLILFILLLLY